MSRPARDPWLGVEVRHLLALEAVAREGSFRAAADSLGYVQSAVSQQVAHLERLVGTRLLDRPAGAGPVVLTPAGEVLSEHVAVLLRRYALASDDVARVRGGEHDTLRVGVLPHAALRALPAASARLRRGSPPVVVEPHEEATGEALVAALERDELDAVLGAVAARGALEAVTVASERYVVAVAAGSVLARSGQAPSARELGGLALVGLGEGEARRTVDAWFAAAGVTPGYVAQTEVESAVAALVATGLGVAVAPEGAIADTGTGVVALTLPPGTGPPPRTTRLVWRRDDERAPLLALRAALLTGS